jgi:hypothetical protein
LIGNDAIFGEFDDPTVVYKEEVKKEAEFGETRKSLFI